MRAVVSGIWAVVLRLHGLPVGVLFVHMAAFFLFIVALIVFLVCLWLVLFVLIVVFFVTIFDALDAIFL
jgi:hypothetical protein